jgi:hypothetical protein
MKQTSFFVQGVFTGEANMGRLEFEFTRGPDHILWVPERQPPPDRIGAMWMSEESICATTDELPRDAIRECLAGPDGHLKPGDYDVMFKSYEYFRKKPHSKPIRATDGKEVRALITVQFQEGRNRAHCQLEERAIADLLSSLVRKTSHHKELRIPDHNAAMLAMFLFIDPGSVRRCCLRYASALGKLIDYLHLEPPVENRTFCQVFHRFDFKSFYERLKNPAARLAFFELRNWLDVQDETLRNWLIDADLATPRFHGRSYTCSVEDFRNKFVPKLQSKIDSSPVGDKIDSALRTIDLAP